MPIGGSDRHNADTLVRDAERAMLTGNELHAERSIGAYLRRKPNNVRLLHHRALLLRALDRRSEALEVFDHARRVSPSDPKLALAHAQTALEAGHPASCLFEGAVRLAPGSTDARLGLAAARLAENAGDRALCELEALLAANPGWYEGHRQFAQLAAMARSGERAFETTDKALGAFPKSIDLHALKIDLLLAADRNEAALVASGVALRNLGRLPEFLFRKAVAHDELGQFALSGALFSQFGRPTNLNHAVRYVRHLIRTRQFASASEELEPWLDDQNGEMWPYAAVVWRSTSDSRSGWLEDQRDQIQVIDLPPEQVGLSVIADELNCLHENGGRFLDQSVRGGTQTDGRLLARETPSIVSLRETLSQQVATYIAKLPPAVAKHPHLAIRRNGRARFAGSWSVRLRDAGYHEAHHHPTGWLSGVLYVAVPSADDARQGNLEIGGSVSALGLAFEPRVTVRSKPGRLVLFPSFMWHGTTPFARGLRTTVAFDIARPLPDA